MRRFVAGLGIGLVFALVIGACGAPTWPKTAAETTCADWSNTMTSSQRDALGTAILTALRSDDGGRYMPRDEVIKAYIKAIGDTCKDNPDASVAKVGATLYGLSRDLHP
ncbi:MAG: hypothetical protein ABUL47_05585 [Leifsonia sp.]